MSEFTKAARKLLLEYVAAVRELLNGFDKKDQLVSAVLLGLTSLVWILQSRGRIGITLSFSGVLAVAVIFLTYYQVKGQQSGTYPDYPHPRPDFIREEEGPPILGLRNFGGPALNLSIYGRITGENVHEGVIIRDSETVNLRNNEYVSLAKGDFEDLFNPNFLEGHAESKLELYYSFEAVSGRSFPSEYPRDKEIKDIADDHSGPRTVQIREIIERRDKA